MIIKTNITWREYQKKTIASIIHSQPGVIHTLCSPRQCGKTTILENILMYYGINNAHSFSIFVSPTYKQCRKVFAEMRKALMGTAAFLSANESSMQIEFTNGSIIAFLSGESSISALQGYTVKKGILIFDEAAYLQDEIFQALFPSTDVYKCPIVLASTPRLKDGTFYEYFIRGEQNVDGIVAHNWKGNTLLTPQKLQFYRETLPKNVFRNYYLGEFADFGDGVFGDFTACLKNSYEPGYELYMGVDFSTGSLGDDTSITIFNSLKQMVYIDAFNDKDETETIDYIIEVIKKYRPRKVTVETNSIGKIFYGLLRKKLEIVGVECQLRGITTTNESKQRQVQKLQVSIQNQECTFLHNKKFIGQLNSYAATLSKTGKVVYNAISGCHDDMIISTMIAFDSIDSGRYCIGT